MRAEVPPIRFASNGSARLAYQMWGDGPATIVGIPPTAQSIELAWERPELRYMFDRFGHMGRYLHFDKRGTGASARRTQVNGIDERVEDLKAIMDEAEIDNAFLYAASEGGPMAILFAATYPHRVDGLILYGTGARILPPMSESERANWGLLADVFCAQWGTPDSLVPDLFAPSLAGDGDFRTWHQRYERHAATSESLRELLELGHTMDVSELLQGLDVPTLVIHRTGDLVTNVQFGRDLAAGIPGAELFEQVGADHFGYAGDVDGWMDEMERFVTGTVRERPSAPPPSLSIETLGRFALLAGGEEIPTSAWGSRQARQLCKRLVAARGWPVTRDQLADMLWPDEPDPALLGPRLSVQLSAVRRMLGGGVIADRDTVRIDLEHVSTDLEAFMGAKSDDDIVGHYGGTFLPEDIYEDWSRRIRDEAAARFIGAARRLADAALADSEFERAGDLARQIVAVDAFDEAAHELLVRALMAKDMAGPARLAHQAWVEAMAEIDVSVPPFDDVSKGF